MVLVGRFPITREKQAALAKLAAQARLERQRQQSEASRVTSEQGPRDVQAVSDILDKVGEMGHENIADEMHKNYVNFRSREYQDASSGPSPKIGASLSDISCATTASTRVQRPSKS